MWFDFCSPVLFVCLVGCFCNFSLGEFVLDWFCVFVVVWFCVFCLVLV